MEIGNRIPAVLKKRTSIHRPLRIRLLPFILVASCSQGQFENGDLKIPGFRHISFDPINKINQVSIYSSRWVQNSFEVEFAVAKTGDSTTLDSLSRRMDGDIGPALRKTEGKPFRAFGKYSAKGFYWSFQNTEGKTLYFRATHRVTCRANVYLIDITIRNPVIENDMTSATKWFGEWELKDSCLLAAEESG
jgi:hypothetical protein